MTRNRKDRNKASSFHEMSVGAAFAKIGHLIWQGNKDEMNPYRRLEECVYLVGSHTSLAAAASLPTIDKLKERLQRSVRPGKAIRSPSTINRFVSAYTTFLHACEDREWIEYVPKVSRFREPDGRADWIKDEEILTLLEVMPKYQGGQQCGYAAAAFLEVAVLTGMRRGEIAAVVPSRDIHQEADGTWVLTLRDTKNGDSRTLEIVDRVVQLLLDYSPWGLAETGSSCFVDGQLYRVWKWAKEEAGIDPGRDFVFHLSRYSAGTMMTDEGLPLHVIQSNLGHRSIQTTIRYARISSATRSKASACLSKRLEAAKVRKREENASSSVAQEVRP